MSVLSLPVVLSQSTSPCLVPCCNFRRARFLRESRGRRCGPGVQSDYAGPPTRTLSPPGAHAGPPAVVLKALLEAPPLLFGGLPAAQASVLEDGEGSGSSQSLRGPQPCPKTAHGVQGARSPSSTQEQARRLRPACTP